MKERILQFRVMAKAVMIGLLLGVAGKAYAYDFSAVCETGQKLYYNIIDATNRYVMLTSPYYDQGWSGYTKPTGVIVLPESVQNNGVKYSVVAIGSHAFWLCNGLIGSLTIPSSIVEIGYMAFSGCSGFTGTLTIPNSVTSIDSWAFENCSGLTGSLIIPNSVTSIRGSAFRNCNGLETIEVEVGNPIYDSRENCNAVIMTSTNELVLGCKNTIIPNNITSIGSYAFAGCTGLTGELTIPNTVTMIGDAAFLDCNGLTGELNIPNPVTSIGSEAFRNCNGLTSIIIPSSVTIIGSGAFDGTTWYNNQADGILYLSNCCLGYKGQQPVGQLRFREGTRLICETAFSYCQGLSSISFPISVNSINYGAFLNCSGLTSIIMIGNTPPSLCLSHTGSVNVNNVFSGTNNCPIYVPYESLNAYKTATNWSNYANRIYPMSYTTIPAHGENDGWHFIASPLAASTAPTEIDNMLPTAGTFDFYRFDQSETAEWQNYKATSFNLANGQGYLYANQEDVNLIFKGSFNEGTSQEVGLTYDGTAQFAGWNLVGNPFPYSATVSRSYYVMNEDGTAIEPTPLSSGSTIAACTGIMVKADGANESVTFSKATRQVLEDKGLLHIVLSQVVERPLNLSKGGVSSGSTTAAIDKAIVSFNAEDALEKFVFNAENAQISIPQGGKDYAIATVGRDAARHVSTEMPINFKVSKNGTYTISVSLDNVVLDYLHLIDNMMGSDTDLLASPNYTFTAKTTDYASRFRLVFSGQADGPSADEQPFAYISNGNIVINEADALGASLHVVDMTGRIVLSTGGHTQCVPTTGIPSGVYLLRLVNGDEVKTLKIVID